MSIVLSVLVAVAGAYGMYRLLWPDTKDDLAALAQCRSRREDRGEVADEY